MTRKRFNGRERQRRKAQELAAKGQNFEERPPTPASTSSSSTAHTISSSAAPAISSIATQKANGRKRQLLKAQKIVEQAKEARAEGPSRKPVSIQVDLETQAAEQLAMYRHRQVLRAAKKAPLPRLVVKTARGRYTSYDQRRNSYGGAGQRRGGKKDKLKDNNQGWEEVAFSKRMKAVEQQNKLLQAIAG